MKLSIKTSWPVALASAATIDVFPTPGLPSSKIAREGIWRDLISRNVFKHVVGASNVKSTASTLERGTEKQTGSIM